MTNRIRVAYILFTLLLLTLNYVSITEASSRTVKVAAFNLKPLIFIDSDKTVKGLNVDLLNIIANEQGWDLNFIPGSWNDGLQRARHQQVDLLTTVMHTEERASFLDYTQEPFFTVWSAVYALPKSHLSSILSLKGKKIAIMKGDQNGKNFKQIAKQFDLKCSYLEVPSFDDVFKAVQSQTVIAGVSVNIYGMLNLNTYQLQQTPIIFSPKPIYFAVPQGTNNDILNALDATLRHWKQDETSTYYKLLNTWLTAKEASKSQLLPQWVAYALGSAAIALLLIYCWNRMLKRKVRQKTIELTTQAQKLKESEKKLRLLFSKATEAVFIIERRTGRYVDANQAAADLTGRTLDELKNLTTQDVCPEGSTKRIQTIQKNMDSINFGEICYQRPDGQKRTAMLSAIPINNELSYGIAYDITEMKHLESQLRQKFKMEGIGVMAGGIAHNFNNSLAIILGSLEMALRKHNHPDKVLEYINHAKTATLRSRDLISQILSYSRQGQLEKQTIQLHLIIDEIQSLLQATLPSTVELDYQVESDVEDLVINGDPGQIQEVMLNLCNNAVHAMEEKGTIRIGLTLVKLPEDEKPPGYNDRSGHYACIQVTDNGKGMDQNTIDRIFDPFFSTKKLHEGTGMGLATVQGIVNQHNGLIKVESEVGKGSTFEVYLAQSGNLPEGNEKIDQDPAKGTETILLVDDEPQLLEISEKSLIDLGYNVVTAPDARTALDTFTKEPQQFDLLITDQTMPIMTGTELVQKIKQIAPELPIILTTGYSNKISEEQIESYGISAFSNKPLQLVEISHLIRKVLEKDISYP